MPTERITGRRLQALRLRIWSANPHCAMCGALTAWPHGFELDHIIALTNEGTNDDSNLQVLDHACHEAKTNADLGYTPKVATGADGWPCEVSEARASAARWKRAARG